jgi:predicted component of type VI protein secretion system
VLRDGVGAGDVVKPNEARRRRLQEKAAATARGDALEAFLRGGGDSAEVRPDLIPTAEDHVAALREYRKAARLVAGALGVKRARLMDGLVFALARIVYVERVLALDPLERAGLTPARLVMLSKVHPDELQERLARFQGDARVEVSL